MKWIDHLRFRWWEWSDATPSPKQRLPTVIQFPVNDICNSQCQMCHIWQRKRDHEITPEELSSILSNPLFREVRNVGINGGEPTLRRDIGELTQVIIAKLPRLRGVSLITNAIQEDRVLSAVDDVGGRCNDGGVHLDVMVSVDGVGEVHDRVRGVKGNFVSADRVLDMLMKSPVVGSCRIGCTLISENVYDAENVLAYARSKGIYARFRAGIPHQRLYTRDIRAPFDLDEQQRHHLACFLDELRLNYEKDFARRAFYLSLRNQLVYNAPRVAGCLWKNRGVTLTSRGDLAYCAVESPTLGSLLQESAADLYWKNEPLLRDINTNRCAHCLHDYDGIQDRRILAEEILRNGIRRLPYGRTALNAARHVRFRWADRAAARASSKPLPPRVNGPLAGANQAVLLCGWYGTETLGDKAILSGLITSLRCAGWKGPIDLVSLEPFVSSRTNREMPELALRNIETVASARQRIASGEYRLVAIAGGPLMSAVGELFDLLSLFSDATAAGAARAVLGCGVGPLGFSGLRDKAIFRLLNLSQETVFRDQASRDLAQTRLSFSGAASVLPDPAFIWAQWQIQRMSVQDAEGPILLALREWQVHEYGGALPPEKAAEVKQRFEREIIVMVQELRRLFPGVPLLPFAMHTYARGGDDRMFFQRLFHNDPELLSAGQWKRSAPDEDFALFRRARGVVAMRFHSALLAIAARMPHVAIDYTQGGKIASLLSSVHAPPALPLEGFSGRECARRLFDVIHNTPPEPPSGVAEAYAAVWGRCLSLGRS